jgi:tetratricopeptide (TPR) repeat protein
VELSGTPFFPQEAYQCGPAALATVLNAQDVEASPEMLVDEVYLPARKGSLQLEMVAAARSYGMVVTPLAPRLDALLSEIAAGNPVLVFQNLAFNWYPHWHYAVAVGYDMEQGVLILRSGTTERRITPFATFERTWRRVDYWAQVILPPGKLPVGTEPLDYVQAVHALEQTGNIEQALLAYRTAVQCWPDDKTALMAWGNAEYGAGHLEQAEDAFRQVISHYPSAADAWNNLAYVLSARQCGRAAQQAIACALLLQPADENIQGSVQELRQRPEANREGCMPVVCPVQAGR